MDTLNSVLLLAGGPRRLCCRTIRGRRGFCSCLLCLDQALGTAMRGLFNDKITGRVTDDDDDDYDDGDDDIVGIDDVDNDDHNGGADGDEHGVDNGGENCDTGCQNSGRSESKRGSDDTALTNSTGKKSCH